MKKLAVAFAFALQSGAVTAQEFTSPLDVLETLYAAYVSGKEVRDLSPYFSEGLTKEMGNAAISPEIIAAMGVDPLIGASDPQLTQLNIAAAEGGEERAVINVRFHNRGMPVELTFELVLESEHGWQIDQLEGKSGDVEWCTRSIVEATSRLAASSK